ncbi:MAG: hypothetical protein WCF65_06140 [Parachlamydiaceae bacterium]
MIPSIQPAPPPFILLPVEISKKTEIPYTDYVHESVQSIVEMIQNLKSDGSPLAWFEMSASDTAVTTFKDSGHEVMQLLPRRQDPSPEPRLILQKTKEYEGVSSELQEQYTYWTAELTHSQQNTDKTTPSEKSRQLIYLIARLERIFKASTDWAPHVKAKLTRLFQEISKREEHPTPPLEITESVTVYFSTLIPADFLKKRLSASASEAETIKKDFETLGHSWVNLSQDSLKTATLAHLLRLTSDAVTLVSQNLVKERKDRREVDELVSQFVKDFGSDLKDPPEHSEVGAPGAAVAKIEEPSTQCIGASRVVAEVSKDELSQLPRGTRTVRELAGRVGALAPIIKSLEKGVTEVTLKIQALGEGVKQQVALAKSRLFMDRTRVSYTSSAGSSSDTNPLESIMTIERRAITTKDELLFPHQFDQIQEELQKQLDETVSNFNRAWKSLSLHNEAENITLQYLIQSYELGIKMKTLIFDRMQKNTAIVREITDASTSVDNVFKTAASDKWTQPASQQSFKERYEELEKEYDHLSAALREDFSKDPSKTLKPRIEKLLDALDNTFEDLQETVKRTKIGNDDHEADEFLMVVTGPLLGRDIEARMIGPN